MVGSHAFPCVFEPQQKRVRCSLKRLPFKVGLCVFAFSVVTELLSIRILRGSLSIWLEHPHRRVLLLSLILVNLLNAATAAYLSRSLVEAELQLERTRNRQREASIYLNDHLRNALSIVQNAAFLTQDEQTMKLCDDAVSRIVKVLVSTEAGLVDPSQTLLQYVRPLTHQGKR